MKLRGLLKVLIISLAIVMAGGTTMVWYSQQTKKAAGEDDAATKPILTVNKCVVERNDILFCTLDTNGTEIPCLLTGYALQPMEMLFEPQIIESGSAGIFRRIPGNPPIRAAPEPKGPL